MSALMSGSEVAYFSISPKQLDELNNSDSSSEKEVLSLLAKPAKLLATILVANNFINIAIVTVSTFLMSDLLIDVQWSRLTIFIVEIGVVTFIILLFGEVLPKVYATSSNLKFAKLMSKPIIWTSKLFYPIIALLLSSGTLTDKWVKKKPNDITVNELGHALELTMQNADEDEQKILEGIVNFGNINVKQIMTPRTATTAFDLEMEFGKLIKTFVDSGHSRIPIYKDSFDTVEGVLYLKDLIPHIGLETFDWHSLIRDAYFVPENKMIDDLLKDFQSRKMHLAIVVDEYGGTSGIVTLEDVIEEIVGEITDEFDEIDVNYSKLDDDNYSFEGSTPLVDLYRIMEIENSADFEKVKGEADTIAGFVIELAEKIPLKNEKVKFNDYVFTVEAADKRRVKQVKITRNEEVL
ncbi:MAG: putative hemolysin [Patiriisocius sp.]|jgi:putative hemolysin